MDSSGDLLHVTIKSLLYEILTIRKTSYTISVYIAYQGKLQCFSSPIFAIGIHQILFHGFAVHSKNICPMLHQKEELICWLLKFFLSYTIINGKLHQKMVKSSNISTKICLNSVIIFGASKSVLLFGAT